MRNLAVVLILMTACNAPSPAAPAMARRPPARANDGPVQPPMPPDGHCPASLDPWPLLSETWPACHIDGPPYSLAARCQGACSHACRTEIVEQGHPPEYVSHYAYDAAGRLLARSTFDEMGTRLERDEIVCGYDGTRLSVCTLGGSALPMRYDSARLVASGSETDYAYDTEGRLASTTSHGHDPPIVTTFAYDSAGRLAVETDDLGTRQYDYDREGRLERVGTPKHAVIYGYGPDGRMAFRDEGAGSYWVFHYDARGRLVEEALADDARATPHRFLRHTYECP